MKREQPKTPKGGVTKGRPLWMLELKKPGVPWRAFLIASSKRNALDEVNWYEWLEQIPPITKYRIRKYIRDDR